MKLRNEVLAVDLLPPALGYLSRATVRAAVAGDLGRGRDSDGVVDLELLKRAFPDVETISPSEEPTQI